MIGMMEDGNVKNHHVPDEEAEKEKFINPEITENTEDGNTSSDADTFYLGDEASVKKKEAEVAKRPIESVYGIQGEELDLLKFVRIEKDKAEKALACSKHAAATTQLKAKAAAERYEKAKKNSEMADNLPH
ncbi:hypothetical protein Tco_0731552 [Tanacetum coccineum]